MSDNIATGTSYVIRGAKLLTHKNLRPFVIVPLVVNILVFGSLIGWGLSFLDTLGSYTVSGDRLVLAP